MICDNACVHSDGGEEKKVKMKCSLLCGCDKQATHAHTHIDQSQSKCVRALLLAVARQKNKLCKNDNCARHMAPPLIFQPIR